MSSADLQTVFQVPYIVAEPLPSNLLEWHYVVRWERLRLLHPQHLDGIWIGLICTIQAALCPP